MKIHPQFINGGMILMTECGQIIENVTTTEIQCDAQDRVTYFTATFTHHPVTQDCHTPVEAYYHLNASQHREDLWQHGKDLSEFNTIFNTPNKDNDYER